MARAVLVRRGCDSMKSILLLPVILIVLCYIVGMTIALKYDTKNLKKEKMKNAKNKHD